jgi:hypothetical protein
MSRVHYNSGSGSLYIYDKSKYIEDIVCDYRNVIGKIQSYW